MVVISKSWKRKIKLKLIGKLEKLETVVNDVAQSKRNFHQ